MSKPKVARVQADPPSIPLDDVTITCYRSAHFVGEEGEQPVTITGRQLGQVLAWLAQTRPGLIGPDAALEELWSPSSIALNLEGLAEVLKALSTSDLENIPIEVPSVLDLLANLTGDLAARLNASEHGNSALKRATIALPTRKPAAA
jgi:hypothetical protein